MGLYGMFKGLSVGAVWLVMQFSARDLSVNVV